MIFFETHSHYKFIILSPSVCQSNAAVVRCIDITSVLYDQNDVDVLIMNYPYDYADNFFSLVREKNSISSRY